MLGGASDDDQVRARQLRERFAQRACGQHAAVAKAAGAIDHHQLAVARQAQVLQAVIRDHQVRAPGDECGHPCGPVRRHDRGTAAAPRQQHGFIPDFAPVGARGHRLHTAPVAAVAARDDADVAALCASGRRRATG